MPSMALHDLIACTKNGEVKGERHYCSAKVGGRPASRGALLLSFILPVAADEKARLPIVPARAGIAGSG